MAQGRSTKIISMIKLIRTSRLSIKISLSLTEYATGWVGQHCGVAGRERPKGEGATLFLGVDPVEAGDRRLREGTP